MPMWAFIGKMNEKLIEGIALCAIMLSNVFMWNQGKVHPREKLQQESCNILLHGLISHGISAERYHLATRYLYCLYQFFRWWCEHVSCYHGNMGCQHGTNVKYHSLNLVRHLETDHILSL